MTDPRFTDEQFAEILRKATELQARQSSRTPSAGTDLVQASGMSLTEIQSIAGEVGIAPELVARAASLVVQDEQEPEGRGDRWLLKSSLPGTFTDEDKIRVLRAIRDASEVHGEVDMSGAGLEWKEGDVVKTIVSVASLDEQNEVRVSVDANASAVLSQVFPTIGGFLLSAAVGASLELGLVAGLSTAAIGIGTGFTVGRTIWHQVRKKALDRSRRILAAATSALPVGTSNHDDGDDA